MNKLLLAGALVASFAGGYAVAPREQLDTVVKQDGVFTTDTTEVLAATVTSLKE